MNNKSDFGPSAVSAEDKAQLNSAKMATFKRIAWTNEAVAFVDAMYEQVCEFELQNELRSRRRRSGDAKTFRIALGAFIGDLLISASHSVSGGYFYRSQEKDALNATKVSYTSFWRLVDVFEKLDLLERYKGYRVNDRFEDADKSNIPLYGKAGRYRATQKLIDFAIGFGVDLAHAGKHFPIDPEDKSALVECRPADKQKIHIEQRGDNLKLLQKAQDEISRINQIYAKHTFGSIDQPRIRRIFNNADQASFMMDQGGRLSVTSADDWMNNKEVRSKIKIDDESIVKVDVSSCHLTIAMGLLGFDFDPTHDLYHIDGIPREVVKLYISMRLGLGRRPARWKQGASEVFKAKNGVDHTKKFKVSDLNDVVERKIPVLVQAESAGLTSVKLQFIEAEILIATILELGEDHNIAVLPIHDCIVVPKSKLEFAKEILGFHFSSRAKVNPKMTVVYD